MVLANLSPDQSLNCIKQIQNKLPGNSYMLTNRSLLCHCSVQNGLSFIRQDIGSCNNETVLPTFQYTTNLAFMGAYKVMRKLGDGTSSSFPQANISEHIAQTTPKPFPLDLNNKCPGKDSEVATLEFCPDKCVEKKCPSFHEYVKYDRLHGRLLY